MPASSSRPNRRNNKPKSAKNKDTTALIHHSSSPTLQLQGLYDLNFQDQEKLRVSAMENSSNGKVEETPEVQSQDEYKEVVVEDVRDSNLAVESVKKVEIDDDSEPATKREVSIFENIIDSAEKILDGDDSSSSSSSSDDEKEREFEEKSPQVEEDSVKDDLNQVVGEEIGDSSAAGTMEEKVSSLVENVEIPPVVEDLVSKVTEGVTSVVLEVSEEAGLPSPDQKNEANNPTLEEEVSSKGTEENPGESSEAAYEASNENVHNPEIPENKTIPSVVPVTRDSLQRASWTSCCGLFEVLRRSN